MVLKRRSFIKTAVAAGSVAMLPKTVFAVANNCKQRTVVVIGGGFAGATAAKYIRLWGPDIDVILIERNAQLI